MEQIKQAKEKIGAISKTMNKLEAKVEMINEWADER